MNRPTIRILLVTLCLALSACAGMKSEEDEQRTAREFFEEGRDALRHGDYELAVEFFEKLEAHYPFGRYAHQALLASAYAYYKREDPEAAIATADRFIKLHPTHPDVDYAYYLKGLAKFHSRDNFLDDVFAQDPSKRDPGAARQSFQYFAELVKRFPQSRYAPDAIQRMIYLRNSLAEYELYVAGYYMRRGAYLAAASRAVYIIENYARTPATGEALFILAESYRQMGIEDLAVDADRVLEASYPERPRLTEHEPPALE